MINNKLLYKLKKRLINLYAFTIPVNSISFSKSSLDIIEKQAMANSRLKYTASVDFLTDLYTYQTLMSELGACVNSYPEDKIPFCFAMIDVDDFKNVNDEYGHDCGDKVLVTLAKCISECCRQSDIACRYGGDEFAVIFRETSLEEALVLLSKMLEKFKNSKYTFTERIICFSGGLVQYDGNSTRDELFKAADNLLYKAKQKGKNKILYNRVK